MPDNTPPLFDTGMQRAAGEGTAKRRAAKPKATDASAPSAAAPRARKSPRNTAELTQPHPVIIDTTLAQPAVKKPRARKPKTAIDESILEAAPTTQVRRVTRPRATTPNDSLGPNTINLPAIPKPVTRPLPAVDPMTGMTTALKPITRPLPTVGTDTSPMRSLQKLSREQTAAIKAYDAAVLPGARKHRILLPSGAPQLHPKARKRQHRFVTIGALVALLLVALSFAPITRGANSPIGALIADAGAFALPTPTPTATATPVIYPSHPVVGGVNSFVCTALPFARLAQSRQLANGQSHPWYVSLILAQWGVEQGWHMPTYTGYNFGNVSAIAGFPSVGGINVPGSPGAFAYAYTPIQGVAEYVIFTGNGKYYGGVTANYPNGPRAQALALGQSPWDADHYALNGQRGGKLLNAMNAYNLFRFDNPNATC